MAPAEVCRGGSRDKFGVREHRECVFGTQYLSARAKTVNNNSFDVFILQQPLSAARWWRWRRAVSPEFLCNKSMSERKRLPLWSVCCCYFVWDAGGAVRWENAISLMAFALPSQHLLNFLYRWGFSHVTGTQRTGLYREGLILAIATRQTQFTRGPLFDFLSQLLIFKTTRTHTLARWLHSIAALDAATADGIHLFSGVLFK